MSPPTCASCGLPLLASRSLESGVCAACHPDGVNIETTDWPQDRKEDDDEPT